MNDYLTSATMLYDLVHQAQQDSQAAFIRVTLNIRVTGPVQGVVTILNLDNSIYQEVQVLVSYWSDLYDQLADFEFHNRRSLVRFMLMLQGDEALAVEKLSERLGAAA